ncbi:MAG: hypothetical protein M1830_000422 [Pleopsidium flavum]|nr:MAG: hypothetical protein M1830_000422 [Pleopsidium flavum]
MLRVHLRPQSSLLSLALLLLLLLLLLPILVDQFPPDRPVVPLVSEVISKYARGKSGTKTLARKVLRNAAQAIAQITPGIPFTTLPRGITGNIHMAEDHPLPEVDSESQSFPLGSPL